MNSLQGASDVSQTSLDTAISGTVIAGSQSSFLQITNIDVAKGVFEVRYAQSQRDVAAFATVAIGGPLAFEAGLVGRAAWAAASRYQKLRVLGMANRGFKKFVKELDNLEIVDDVLSGGLKAPKYSPEPLPKPAYTTSQKF